MSNTSELDYKTVVADLPKGLTLCENLVVSDNAQDNIDFFVGNSISSFKNLKSYGENYFTSDLKLHMEVAGPRYTASVNEQGGVTVRKFFVTSNDYQNTPPAKLYQAFEKAVVDNQLASADYFRDYEQKYLEIVQNIIAEEGIPSESVEYAEGDFCLLYTRGFERVECVGETACTRADAINTTAEEL